MDPRIVSGISILKQVTRNSASGIHGSIMTWQLKFPKARFHTGNTRIDLELGQGLQCIVRSENEKPGSSALAAIEIQPIDHAHSIEPEALVCEDAYVRQNDLIATFPQTVAWAFGFQVDVRTHEKLTDSICGIEFWLSIQTSLLKSNPGLVVTPLPIGPRWMRDGILVADSHRAAILIHPLDQSDCTITLSPGTKELERLEVFGGFMEKGVIRRARLFLAWSDSEVKASLWQDLLQSFSDSPLPLTV